MNIVADPNIPFVREAFGPLGPIQLVPGRQMTAAHVRDAELLLVRSVTKVDAALLGGSKVRYVATATIGTDHIDRAYLAAQKIGFASAAGSNANSVAEYVVAAMLELAHRKGFRLRDKTLGIVGVGNIGKILVRYAGALGMRVLQNDPPRQRVEGDSQFVSLEEVLAQADIITLHVPLAKSGPDKTLHLLNESTLFRLARKPILINSARGAAVDNPALLRAIEAGKLRGVVLDVWENEPNILLDLLARVDIATPHIAGYSFDGKVNGTTMIYRAACAHFSIPAHWSPAPLMPKPTVPRIEMDGSGRDDEDLLREIIVKVYAITADHAALRQSPSSFDKLRAEYPVRREFFNTELKLTGAPARLAPALVALGWQVL